MSEDKITQFELLLMELNRNIAYKERSIIQNNYNQLNSLYQEILKSDIPIEEKNKMYSSVLGARESIENMDKHPANVPVIVTIFLGALISGVFIIKGPEMTGMSVSGTESFLSPIARFAPAVVVAGLIVFMILRNRNKK